MRELVGGCVRRVSKKISEQMSEQDHVGRVDSPPPCSCPGCTPPAKAQEVLSSHLSLLAQIRKGGDTRVLEPSLLGRQRQVRENQGSQEVMPRTPGALPHRDRWGLENRVWLCY